MAELVYKNHVAISWQKTKVANLKDYTQKSNFKGALQTLGFLAVIFFTGFLSYYFFSQKLWVAFAFALYLHGTVVSFSPHGIHELSHLTVFKTKWLNYFFGVVLSLVYWPRNFFLYRISHRRHHNYTLHSDYDGEAVSADKVSLAIIIKLFLLKSLNFMDLGIHLAKLLLLIPSFKPLKIWPSTWEHHVLFYAKKTERRNTYKMAFLTLFYILAVVALSIYFKNYIVIVIVLLAPFYGGGAYASLISLTQHVGMKENTNKFVENCRTVQLDPITSFLYWHMEYHVEHHTYAAVPCYNLKYLQRDHFEKGVPFGVAVREMIFQTRHL